MKQAVWGYAVLVLGVIAIMITWFFAQVTNTDQHNYNLLKETVENAMYDAVDLSAYRKDGTVRIDETKFVESFVRRFAENADLSNTYQVDIYDVNEVPPKVSLSVNSCKQTNGTTCTNSAENLTFTISNKIDAILEAEWDGEKAGYINIAFDAGAGTAEAIQTDGQTKRGSSIRLLIKKGDPIPIATFTLTGCTFKGWYDVDGTKLSNGLIAVENKTYVAKYNANTYNINYTLNGATNSGSATTYTYGSGTTLTNPTKTGHTCIWCTDSALNNCSSTQTISKTEIENKSYYAKCTANTYTISPGYYLKAGGTGGTSCTAGNYCPGGTFTYNTSSNQGLNACPSGYTSAKGATAKSKCYISVADGKYLGTVNSSTTSSCGKGTYKKAHTVYYGSTSSCTTCSAGKYNTTVGNTTCATCPVGSYCTGGSNITSCGSGKTSAAGSTSSSACKSTYKYYKWNQYGSYCWNFAQKYMGGGNNYNNGKLYLCPTANDSGCVVASNTACSNINNKYSYFRLEG